MSKTTTSQSIAIPLNQLTAWEGNVRKTASKASIEELAASIHAHGLLQSPIVQKMGKKYKVIAGRRRFFALNQLAEEGKIAADHPVQCQLADAEASATEISLVENVVREQMHPADEFEAFRDLLETGMPMADVAARFGVTETVVRKRLVLADVSPVIIQAFRDGELSLSQVQAFAVSNDHARQEQIFENLRDWDNDPSDIRSSMTEDDVSASDRRVKFVTLEAYEQAGGTLRRDLFSDDENGIYIEDIVLLDRLVKEKLEAEAEKVRGEGWKWVEVHPEFSYMHRYKMKLVQEYADFWPISAEAQEEIEQLRTSHDALLSEIGDEEATDEQNEQLDEIDERIEVLQKRPRVWKPEVIANGGAVVSIGYHGKLEIERGLIKPEDRAALQGKQTDASGKGEGGKVDSAEKDANALSASLIHELTSHKTAAISTELAQRPDIALAAVVHAMTQTVLFPIVSHHGDNCLQIVPTKASLAGAVIHEGASSALANSEALRQAWLGATLPDHPKDLWQWCLDQTTEKLLELLAFVASVTVNAVVQNGNSTGKGDYLAEALDLDMAKWFTPTAANYFSRISKPQILSAVQEIGIEPTPTVEKMKKGELAEYAERVVKAADKPWLPPLLRKAQ